jgi:hypothetical protein
MTVEQDTPPQRNTWRRFVWETVTGIGWLRAFWGRRLSGGAIGLFADLIAEGATQAFFARLVGHPQQAPDSLLQVGRDRDLIRFRGETEANYRARVGDAWDDYDQGGTPQQMLHVIDQWGSAGWPETWINDTCTLVEGEPFEFTITIPFGLIDPPWVPEVYGGGHTYAELGFYYGVGVSTDIPMLLYLVRKWKPARCVGYVRVYYSVSDFVTFRVR